MDARHAAVGSAPTEAWPADGGTEAADATASTEQRRSALGSGESLDTAPASPRRTSGIRGSSRACDDRVANRGRHTPLYVLLLYVVNRLPDQAKDFSKRHRTFSRVFVSVGIPLNILMISSITLILVGVLPGLDVALYTALVSVALAFTVWTLLMLLYRPGEKADEQGARALEDQTDAMR